MFFIERSFTQCALQTVNLTIIPGHEATTSTTGPEVIKSSCSTQLSMKFFMLINVKMPTIVGILTLISRKISILGLSEPEKKLHFLIFLYLLAFKNSCLAESCMEKVYNSGPG